jgi:Uma2 family endonuclease
MSALPIEEVDMTTGPLPHPTHEAWTLDDWIRLNETDLDGNRYELIDGSLTVSPAPAMWHQYAADELRHILRAAAPPHLVPITAVGAPLDKKHGFIPDVLLVTREHLESGATLADPLAVKLAVEIVSPSTTSRDRLLKPRRYAEAGIPHFWRLEPKPFQGQGGDRLPVLFT